LCLSQKIGETMPAKTSAPEEEQDQTQVVNLTNSRVDSVKAELVRMHQSAAQAVAADEIEAHQAFIVEATAEKLSAHETGIGALKAEQVNLTNSGVGVVKTGTANLNGYAGVISAGSANLQNSYAVVVNSQDLQADRIDTLVLLSRHVDGNVQTVVDTRGAILIGMISGLFAGLVLLVGQLVFRRR
jgi:hypothetical protein